MSLFVLVFWLHFGMKKCLLLDGHFRNVSFSTSLLESKQPKSLFQQQQQRPHQQPELHSRLDERKKEGGNKILFLVQKIKKHFSVFGVPLKLKSFQLFGLKKECDNGPFPMVFWLLKKASQFLSQNTILKIFQIMISECQNFTFRMSDFQVFFDCFPVKLVHCDIVSKSSSRVLDILFDLDKAPNQPLKTEPASQRPSSSANVIIISTSNQVISLLTLMTSQSMARTQKSPKVKLIR